MANDLYVQIQPSTQDSSSQDQENNACTNSRIAQCSNSTSNHTRSVLSERQFPSTSTLNVPRFNYQCSIDIQPTLSSEQQTCSNSCVNNSTVIIFTSTYIFMILINCFNIMINVGYYFNYYRDCI